MILLQWGMHCDPAADKCCNLGGKLFRVNQEIGTSWEFFPSYQIYSAHTVIETTATVSKGFRSKPGLQKYDQLKYITRSEKIFSMVQVQFPGQLDTWHWMDTEEWWDKVFLSCCLVVSGQNYFPQCLTLRKRGSTFHFPHTGKKGNAWLLDDWNNELKITPFFAFVFLELCKLF